MFAAPESASRAAVAVRAEPAAARVPHQAVLLVRAAVSLRVEDSNRRTRAARRRTTTKHESWKAYNTLRADARCAPAHADRRISRLWPYLSRGLVIGTNDALVKKQEEPGTNTSIATAMAHSWADLPE